MFRFLQHVVKIPVGSKMYNTFIDSNTHYCIRFATKVVEDSTCEKFCF